MKSCIIALLCVLTIYASLCYAQKYVVETYFVVDDKTIQSYVSEIQGTAKQDIKRAQAVVNINKDIDYILAEVNQMYTTLSSKGLNIEIRQRELRILDTNVFAASDLQNGDTIPAYSGLTLFQNWLTAQKSHETYNYDCAILFTGFDLLGDAGPYTAGYAHVGKICDQKQSIGLVEFGATYLTAAVLAHEIAHILGGSHDGIASDKVMAATMYAQHRHRWEFSDCTATDIKEFLPLLSSNCLLQTNPASARPATTWATYSGQMLNHNYVCQRTMKSSESYMCLLNFLYNNSLAKGDQVCQQIYCQMPDTIYCYPAYTPEGMICDINKRCNKGKCQPDTSPAAAAVDPNSVFGDQILIQLTNPSFNGTCADYITQNGKSACYYDIIGKQLCSKTCGNLCNGPSTCKCGDKSADCVKNSREAVCPKYGSDLCCGFCQGFVGKRSTRERVYNITLVAADYGHVKVLEKEYTVKVAVDSD